ncbi:FAD-dependent monooxygenase [Parapedobacter lycopersici]|uniref:FAD-dependent monooxygenase n=1 Tax=Parapedobacter lycopersici TaxID=1864939 RepID=UPI00214DA952|nr:FAD-dependent monooxygenase [Parapedobacter lycopersici]
MEIAKHTDALIVGAGPSGLMMAAQLLRFGIQPTIIDAKPGPDRTSKAIAVHARTLELLRQLGLADQLLADGFPAYGIQVHGRKKRKGRIQFTDIDQPHTAFPFVLLVGQEKTEKLLVDRLTAHACPVSWATRLLSLRQDDRSATVEVVQNDVVQRWQCKWLIGADGANSTVRDCLKIPFEGKRYPGEFFLADVHITGVQNRLINFFLPRKSLLGIFPLAGEGRYRLVGMLPEMENRPSGLAINYADIKPLVDEAVGLALPVSQCLWISRFAVHRRMAEQFARQRCFLIGDAAHIHAPIGGQGMNSGIQDAVNLAWKLAGVISGRTAPRILHSYERERMPVARSIIRATDGAFGLGMRLRDRLSPLRDLLLTIGMRYIGRNPRLLQKLFDTAAQLAINYRKAGLAVHHATGRRVQAGDRLPFLSVFDEKTKTQTDLHRWCEKPGFVLLLLGTISHHHLHIVGQWMRQKYPREMHLYYLPYSPRNQPVFDAFEIKPDGTKTVLIRPDMHIGYINDMLNVSLIDTYMEEVIGWKYFGHLPENP